MKEIRKELQEIQRYCDITCSENPDEIAERIRDLSSYLSRTADILRVSKNLLRRKKASEISDIIVKIAKEQYLSAKAQNAMIDSIASEEHELVDWSERLNAVCTHQIGALRTLLSYEKEHLKLRETGH